MKKGIRLIAFVLALVMAFSLVGCTIPSADSTPSGTNPAVTISPDMHQTITQLISRLDDAVSTANANYQEALDVLTGDFAAKPEGLESPQYIALKDALETTKEERLTSLSDMIATLQETSRGEITDITNKVAQVEALLSENLHTYGEAIYHSRNSDNILCSEADYYQICTTCNALQWVKGAHTLYFSRLDDTHQVCCKDCSFSEDTAEHILSNGRCNVCNYVKNANILVIESTKGEASQFCGTISSNHTITVANALNNADMPNTAEALQAYHEVILFNIANADLPAGFMELLQSYVQDFGGSLFTVGGDRAYQYSDMTGTIYQDMLPVETVDNSNSVAYMFLVDTSGSMWYSSSGIPYEESKLYHAIQGVEACLDQMTEKEYVGIMAINDSFANDIALFPLSQQDKIIAALQELPEQQGIGSIFSLPLEMAAHALNAMTNADKKHIIIITDGEPSEEDFERYTYIMKQNAAAGITTSIVGIQCTTFATARMKYVLTEYANMKPENFYDVQGMGDCIPMITDALELEDLKYPKSIPFVPTVTQGNGIIGDIDPENMPVLNGFYDSLRKKGATVILSKLDSPIYAQWKYGNGMAGSFMCDLNGTWSADFIASETGKDIVNNIVIGLINDTSATDVLTWPVVGNKIGNKCPSIQIPLLSAGGQSSNTIDPSALGKITIIYFWGSWCGPCKAELPFFDQIADTYTDQVTVVAVHSILGVSNGSEYIAEAYSNSSMIFTVDNRCDETGYIGVHGELFLTLGFRDIYPAIVILDENGVIIYSGCESFHSVEDILAKLPDLQ